MAEEGVAGPALEIFEGFQRPACERLEEAVGDAVKKAAADGKARAVFQLFRAPALSEPIPSVSRRGANAVLRAPADKRASYTKTPFTYRPIEGKNGFENKELLNRARDPGFCSPGFDKCVMSIEKAANIEKAAKYAEERKAASTPTVRLNGKAPGREAEQIFSDPSGLDEILSVAAS